MGRISSTLVLVVGIVAPITGWAQTGGYNVAPPQSSNAVYPASPPQPAYDLEYAQVVQTLNKPLLDEYTDYRTASTHYADGFAGYMMSRTKRLRAGGISMIAAGLVLTVGGLILGTTSIVFLESPGGGSSRQTDIALTCVGFGGVVIGLPVFLIGKVFAKRGKTWKADLGKLIDYRNGNQAGATW